MTGLQLRPGLKAWLESGQRAACERIIETSISWVFLYADRALKLKKPVDFGFLDFTTPEKRRRAAEREVAFNRVTAPDIYRGVHAITFASRNGFEWDGPGEAVDWAVEMRRFDEGAVLSETPDLVQGDLAEQLGRTIGRFHAAAPLGRAGGGAAGMAAVLASNARQLRQLAPSIGDARALTDLTETSFAGLAPLLDRRLAAGFVRRCHGDLHLGNILLEAGRPVLFDCIEFNDAFVEIDVLYDLAFLLMDLAFRGRADGANRVLNGWLDEAARSFDDALWGGLAALGFFQAVRATVRAHVHGHQDDPARARAYLEAAMAHLRPSRPVLVAVGGLSGSGKSTFARRLAPRMSPAPGAVVLRSDEIRKRLWGRAPADRLPQDAYTREASRRVYEAVFAAAGRCLKAGWPVILDAVFLDPAERAEAAAVAARSAVPFEAAWLEAPTEVLESRLEARRADASDADVEVLRAQMARDPGPIAWRRWTRPALEPLAEEMARLSR